MALAVVLTTRVMAEKKNDKDSKENQQRRAAAIEHLGGPTKVGRIFGISRAAVSQWVPNCVGRDHAHDFCDLTGLPMEVVQPRLVRRPIRRPTECAA